MDTSASNPASRAQARLASALGAAALIALVWWLVLPTLATVQYQPTSDDGYYLKYMHEVGTRGPGAIAEQFRWYVQGKKHWIYPPPSRLGFSLVSALWSQFFGVSFVALSQLSLASHLALIAVQFWFARRHLGDFKALLVTALTAFAPLYLGLSRWALTDSFISLCQVLCLWLYFEVVRAPERWSWRIAFVLAFTFAIVTKEISGLLALPFAALAAIERFHRRRALSLPLFVGLLAIPPILAVVAWIAAAGGVSVLVDTMRIVLLSPATNEYAIQYGSGGWYCYPIDEVLASAWPSLLGFAGVALSLWHWRHGEYDALRIYFALVYVLQIAALAFFTKNLRYVAVLEAPLRVLAVLVVCDFVASKRAALSRAAAAAIVALLCWADCVSFQRLFLEMQINDPVTYSLSLARDLVRDPNKLGE